MTIRVVLVDDNPSHLELLRLLVELDDDLDLAGVAGDGEAGVVLAAELQPDLIVSDIEMPRLDGLRAVPGYRAAAPTAAVVLMSSRPPGDAAAQARAAGADAYIDKGTGVDTTIALLKSVVADARRVSASAEPAVVDLREPTVAALEQRAATGAPTARDGAKRGDP